MTLVKYCRFCVARSDDLTPDSDCVACHGTGYTQPSSQERIEFFRTCYTPPK